MRLLAGPVLDGGRSYVAFAELVRSGLATYQPDPGFEITAAGRVALAEAAARSEEVAAIWNAEAEACARRGRPFLASRYSRAAERSLARAASLRGVAKIDRPGDE